jgi:hypothetical protein
VPHPHAFPKEGNGEDENKETCCFRWVGIDEWSLCWVKLVHMKCIGVESVL